MTIDGQALDKLREIVGGSEADLLEIVDSFIEEGPAMMAALLASHRLPDLPSMRRAAHSLKSNARDVGATELAELCARIEARCAAGDAPSADDLDAARQAFAAATAALMGMFHPEQAR